VFGLGTDEKEEKEGKEKVEGKKERPLLQKVSFPFSSYDGFCYSSLKFVFAILLFVNTSCFDRLSSLSLSVCFN